MRHRFRTTARRVRSDRAGAPERSTRPANLLSLLPLLAVVAGPAGLDAQASPPSGDRIETLPTAQGPAPDAPRPRTDGITITDYPERKQLVVTVGPIDLPAHTSHHALDQLPVQTAEMPFDCTIRGYRVELVDRNGEPVPQIVLHHMNLLDPGSRELFLPIMRRVVAASHETPPVSVPGWLFGIPMRGGAPLLALAMLHNPTDRSYEGVEVRLVLEYERHEKLPLFALYPFHVDVMFPTTARKAFDLPPGRTVRSYEGSPAVRGGIVGMGGHVHKYAERLTLEDLTTGETLYEVEPETRPDGRIEKVPVLTHGGRGIGWPVFPNHVYRITVTYFNPTDQTLVDGGMGAIAGGVVPLEGWPVADPTNPLYRADYDWVLRSVEHGEAAGGREHSHGGGGATGRDAGAATGAGVPAGRRLPAPPR